MGRKWWEKAASQIQHICTSRTRVLGHSFFFQITKAFCRDNCALRQPWDWQITNNISLPALPDLKNHKLLYFAIATQLCVDDDKKMTSRRIFSPLSSSSLLHDAKKLKFPGILGSIQLQRTRNLRTSRDLQVMWISLLGSLPEISQELSPGLKAALPNCLACLIAEGAGTLM